MENTSFNPFKSDLVLGQTGGIIASPSMESISEVESSIKGKKWDKRIIDVIDFLPNQLLKLHAKVGSWELALDRKLPNHKLQNILDDFGIKYIEPLVRREENLNAWLNSNDMQSWYTQLCVYLLKLPLRVIRNILRPIYMLLKGTVYSFVHPLKGSLHTLQFIIQFIYSLSKPETYTRLGSGVIGFSLAHVAISAGIGPHAYIGLAVGGGLLLAGITSGAILAGLRAEEGSRIKTVGHALWNHVSVIPEALLTGFVMGCIIGAIQLATSHLTQAHHHHHLPPEASQSVAQKYANQFAAQHQIPVPSEVIVNAKGDIIMSWTGDNFTTFTQSVGHAIAPFKPLGHATSEANNFSIFLQHVPSGTGDNTIAVLGSTSHHWISTGGMGNGHALQALHGYNYPGEIVTSSTGHAIDLMSPGVALTITSEG